MRSTRTFKHLEHGMSRSHFTLRIWQEAQDSTLAYCEGAGFGSGIVNNGNTIEVEIAKTVLATGNADGNMA